MRCLQLAAPAAAERVEVRRGHHDRRHRLVRPRPDDVDPDQVDAVAAGHLAVLDDRVVVLEAHRVHDVEVGQRRRRRRLRAGRKHAGEQRGDEREGGQKTTAHGTAAFRDGVAADFAEFGGRSCLRALLRLRYSGSDSAGCGPGIAG
ncbi:MAG: hypothetical protein M3O86_05305 [Actinomycetota bacterium]|nr:hypothetical protein [Actinomycetota bacterium]